jgi:hypothetical protein
LPVDNEFLKWATGFIFGGGTAATIQGGTALTRLASSKFTTGTGNTIVATGEHAAAFGTSVLSLFTPLMVVAIIIVLMIFIFIRFGKRLLSRRK